MNENFKVACQWCKGHIAYDAEYEGRTVQCPHCGREVSLAVATGPRPSNLPSSNAAELIESRPEGRKLFSARNIAALALLVVLAVAVGLGLQVRATHRADQQRKKAEEAVRSRIETERLQAQAEKAQAEAEIAKLKAEEEAKASAAAKAVEEAAVAEAAAAAKQKAEESAKLEEERKARAKNNPLVLGLWEETNHEAVDFSVTRFNEATVKHKGRSFSVKYDDMPEWLRVAAQKRYKEEGEAKGLVRELNGKEYDLRAYPGGWISLPMAEVIQIIDDGYLLVDSQSLRSPGAQARVFKLIHNGLTRILNKGEKLQVIAMSVGTYTYRTKGKDIETVPVYDPGMPVGPLRERVVTMGRNPPKPTTAANSSADDPIGNGSGFFISEDGIFITNAHVVEDSSKIEVRTSAGKKRATVLRIDKDKDLALLRVSDVMGTVQALNIATNKVALGTQVFTIGYPLVELQGSRPKFTDGKVSSLAGLRDDPDQLQISVPVQPGNSGGPLADLNGDIVGVVVARLNDMRVMAVVGSLPQNVNYAVKGATLLQFLKENRTLAPKVQFGSSPSRTQAEAIQTVENASGMVLVY